MEHQEASLLEDYKSTGDLHLLAKVYQPYMPLVYGLSYKYLKDESLSQDAVMQIFEELIKKLRVHEVTNFKPWLYTYARNFCLMQLRKQSGKQFVDIEDTESEMSQLQNEGFDWQKEHNLQVLEQCLDTLSSEQEVCIRLFYLDQLCYKDIVEKTGYEMNQVKSYIQNGKRNLKICMEKQRHGN